MGTRSRAMASQTNPIFDFSILAEAMIKFVEHVHSFNTAIPPLAERLLAPQLEIKTRCSSKKMIILS